MSLQGSGLVQETTRSVKTHSVTTFGWPNWLKRPKSQVSSSLIRTPDTMSMEVTWMLFYVLVHK
jgi:hypothetical protein